MGVHLSFLQQLNKMVPEITFKRESFSGCRLTGLCLISDEGLDDEAEERLAGLLEKESGADVVAILHNFNDWKKAFLIFLCIGNCEMIDGCLFSAELLST